MMPSIVPQEIYFMLAKLTLFLVDDESKYIDVELGVGDRFPINRKSRRRQDKGSRKTNLLNS